MGITDSIRKFLFKSKESERQPETPEYQEYKRCLAANQDEISRFKRYITQFTDTARAYAWKDEARYRDALEEVNRYVYCLYEAEKTTKFIRPNHAEDIAYRNDVIHSFADKLKKVLPAELDLRFHGTPVYFAEEILKSGSISSSADRFDGYNKSTDSLGEFSVSDINNLDRTVNYFLDVQAYQRGLPCGCLFVLNAAGQTAEQRGRSVMDSVDFNREPERLFAIVTTPENVDKVNGWLSDRGMPQNLSFTFDGFVREMEKRYQKGDNMKSKISLEEKIDGACARCCYVESEKQQVQDLVR